jgi:hypothetical protein
MGDMMVEGLFSLGLQGGRVMILSGGGVERMRERTKQKMVGGEFPGFFFFVSITLPFFFFYFFFFVFLSNQSSLGVVWYACSFPPRRRR